MVWIAVIAAAVSLTPVTASGSPREQVSEHLRCAPGEDPCGRGSQSSNLLAFPAVDVIRVDRDDGGGLRAWVLRRSARQGDPRSVVYEVRVSADGELSQRCVSDIPPTGSVVGEVRMPDALREGGLGYVDGCRQDLRTTRSLGATSLFQVEGAVLTAREELEGDRADLLLPDMRRDPFADSDMANLFLASTLALPPGVRRVEAVGGYGYTAKVGVADRIWLLAASDERLRFREVDGLKEQVERIRALDRRGEASVHELLPGEKAEGTILLGPRSSAEVSVAGLTLTFTSGASGLQLDGIDDPALERGWREAKELLSGSTKAAIWSPPLLLAGERLISIAPEGAKLLCEKMSTSEGALGHPFLMQQLRPAFGDGSLILPWSGGIKVGRCLDEASEGRPR